jgi:hypothetical protein
MSKYLNPFATPPAPSFASQENTAASAATESTPLNQNSDHHGMTSQTATKSWLSSVFPNKEVPSINIVTIESKGKRIGTKRGRVACP